MGRCITIDYGNDEMGPAELLVDNLARIRRVPQRTDSFWRDDVVRLTHLPGEADAVPAVAAVVFRRHARHRLIRFEDVEHAMQLRCILAIVGCDFELLAAPSDGQWGCAVVACGTKIDPVGLARALGMALEEDEWSLKVDPDVLNQRY